MTTKKIEFAPDKTAANVQAYKANFERAALVFADPMRIERSDRRQENTAGEGQWQACGKAGQGFVCCLCSAWKKTRLISAKTANKAEKRSYYGHDNDNHKGWAEAGCKTS
ncbi:MAG: BrnT family toxin [Spirochaetaceae bacterium]|jgi:uncharacterized DUF497 family protein|nr:BrnT family toxin [Spirochaetaceae bacterium]